MLLQHARRDAREVDGERVTLEHQDRSRWHQPEIDEAVALLRRRWSVRGPYAVQADIAAVHAMSPTAGATDWPAIVALYDELLGIAPSPVVALNRAIAVGMSDGALAGLAALESAANDPKLAGHYLVAAARGDLLTRAGLHDEALIAVEQAIELAPTQQERRQLAQRAAELRGP